MTQGFNQDYQKISALLGNYLRREQLEATETTDSHLNEDALSAFVEGNLSRQESKPIISHLAGCGSCRNITAQLIRLEMAFEDEVVPAYQAVQPEAGRLKKFFSDLVSRVFPVDDAVFAHESKPEETEKITDDEPLTAESKKKEFPTD